MKTTTSISPNPKPKLNWSFILAWLFILSLAALPVTLIFFSVNIFLGVVLIFAALFFYHVVDLMYEDHKVKKETRELQNKIDGAKQTMRKL
jgi:Flp pilus assembly protein TadB